MPSQVLANEYRKDTRHRPGHGYGWEQRPDVWVGERPAPIKSLIVHTTNNPRKGTKFTAECEFIRDSGLVSCHDVIGKSGQIATILPPSMMAWHAGVVRVEFFNAVSLGIELHCSVGERPTAAQIDTLTWRVKDLIAQYGITREAIETHRAVAIPKGRKSDPEGWNDAEFYRWRDNLYAPDYVANWGRTQEEYERVAGFGITQLWRQHYQTLGKALTDELMLLDGRLYRAFERGFITWQDGKATVYLEAK